MRRATVIIIQWFSVIGKFCLHRKAQRELGRSSFRKKQKLTFLTSSKVSSSKAFSSFRFSVAVVNPFVDLVLVSQDQQLPEPRVVVLDHPSVHVADQLPNILHRGILDLHNLLTFLLHETIKIGRRLLLRRGRVGRRLLPPRWWR